MTETLASPKSCYKWLTLCTHGWTWGSTWGKEGTAGFPNGKSFCALSQRPGHINKLPTKVKDVFMMWYSVVCVCACVRVGCFGISRLEIQGGEIKHNKIESQSLTILRGVKSEVFCFVLFPCRVLNFAGSLLGCVCFQIDCIHLSEELLCLCGTQLRGNFEFPILGWIDCHTAWELPRFRRLC